MVKIETTFCRKINISTEKKFSCQSWRKIECNKQKEEKWQTSEEGESTFFRVKWRTKYVFVERETKNSSPPGNFQLKLVCCQNNCDNMCTVLQQHLNRMINGFNPTPGGSGGGDGRSDTPSTGIYHHHRMGSPARSTPQPVYSYLQDPLSLKRPVDVYDRKISAPAR